MMVGVTCCAPTQPDDHIAQFKDEMVRGKATFSDLEYDQHPSKFCAISLHNRYCHLDRS